MQKRTSFQKRNLVAGLAALALAACSGGKGGPGSTPGTSGDFVVLSTTPSANGQLYLNEAIKIDFSNEVDIKSANFGSVSFVVFDLNNNQLAEPVQGTFKVTRSSGDTEAGRRLEFRPRFPLSNTFDDGGFRPGRRYIMQLVKGDPRTNVGLADMKGQGLETSFSFSFQTADGTTPSQLFRDTKVGGPRRNGFSVTPINAATGEVELNELGQVPVEIRLSFDQPLNPQSNNVPFSIDLDPASRSVSRRGRVFLEYDDPAGKNTWIPAKVDLERNDLDGAEVVLRPLGVLPNNASIRVIVESTMEDMSGESNVNDAAYDRIFAEFKTNSSYELRFDAVVENFDDTSRLDLEAPFVEPLAALLPGSVRANFAFEGGESTLDYEPSSQEVVLDTDFTQITPKNGQPINVSNGVFQFRNVTIPAGVTVKGSGSRPMVWLVNKDFKVEGRLLVEGGNGQRVNTLNSANFPAGGGVGVCGGGNGGRGSPLTTDRSDRGEAGFGPGQVPGGGGEGGRLSCVSSCRMGSGGGGGSHATKGDPNYNVRNPNTHFVQPRGIGGYGCSSRVVSNTTLAGGAAGQLEFKDPRDNNNFWGTLVDLAAGTRVTGELLDPIGGQGGGGGGDYSTACGSSPNSFANDEKAGGGGAGGGILIIKALGTIEVAKDGLISVDGGDGGGGAWAGSNNRAGGGGGGSGGMVILMAGKEIRIHAHGETYANNDYLLAVTADGGVSQRTPYGSGTVITDKYSPRPHQTDAARYDESGTGGFGGFGVVQLMAPPGNNNDNTNTVLDDNIKILINNQEAGAADKMRYLGWRGFPDGNGNFRDDSGALVNMDEGDGDIRPSPVLMPAPFGSRSRVRSGWLDMGSVVRRNTPQGGDDLPRGVVQQGSLPLNSDFGPIPEFAGVISGDAFATSNPEQNAGYVDTKTSSTGTDVDIVYPVVLDGLAVASLQPGVTYRGGQAMRVTLGQPNATLGNDLNRYSHYRAILTEGPAELGQFRILGHDANVLYLSAEGGSLPSIAPNSSRSVTLDIQAKFFGIFENGVEGFQQSRAVAGNDRLPKANLRIGFAFHRDPSSNDPKDRFPPIVSTGPNANTSYPFFTDWGNPAVMEELRAGGFRYVQYDVVFDAIYEPVGFSPSPESYGPSTPRPELRYLVLPYRY